MVPRKIFGNHKKMSYAHKSMQKKYLSENQNFDFFSSHYSYYVGFF